MAEWKGANRFYMDVTVVEEADRCVIHLDGRTLKTPAGSVLNVIGRPLATAVADEWDAQIEKIDPTTMPMTAFATTLIDRIADRRNDMIANLIGFAETDTLCYRVDEPKDLVQRQHDTWQPLLDWALEMFGAPLIPTTGIMAIPQPTESLSNLTRELERQNDAQLLASASAAAVTGSLVLALALVRSRLDAEAVSNATLLEEQHRIEMWGDDDEALARMQNVRNELKSIERFVGLVSE